MLIDELTVPQPSRDDNTPINRAISFIKNNYAHQEVTIENNIADKYRFDFYGLMRNLGVDPLYWYACMRLNRFGASSDYRGEVLVTILTDTAVNSLFRLIDERQIKDLTETG